MEGNYTYRGFLPHLEQTEHATFVTFRLDDALPKEVYDRINTEPLALPKTSQRRFRWEEVEKTLDAGAGSCILLHPEHAAAMESTLQSGHSTG